MPTTHHQHWYDQTTENGYPLADNASRVDDGGQVIQPGILIDASLRYPDSLGEYPYISALSNGPGLCTVIISVSASLGVPGVAIAAATMTKKADRRLIKVTPLLPGVGGWVVFGPVTASAEVLSYRCTAPSQSLLAIKAAASYATLPVASMKAIQASTGLEGVVQLFGQNPISIVKEVREIEGVNRQCIVFSLTANQGDEFSEADAPVLQEFLGPCDTRPESNTCPDPQPIEKISQVSPDCNGQIVIEFRGCAQAASYANHHGFVLNCSMPRAAVCPSPRIPDSDGNLPNEYNPIIIIGTTTTTTGTTQPPDGSTPGTIDPLPFQECFRDGATDFFATIEGSFNFVTGSDPNSDPYCSGETDSGLVLQATDSGMNLAGFVGTEMKSVSRISLTHVMLTADVGGLINGGLLLNYRFQAGTPRYFTVILDYLRQAIVVYYFNGFTHLQVAISPFTIFMNRWYALVATTVDHGNLGVAIAVNAYDLDFGGDPGELTTNPLLYYRPSDGVGGVASHNSGPKFSHFRYEEA